MWRRADQGDMPPVGQIISVVVFNAADQSYEVIERLRVEVVMAGKFYGPSLPFEGNERVVVPERPEEIAGEQAIMWTETT